MQKNVKNLNGFKKQSLSIVSPVKYFSDLTFKKELKNIILFGTLKTLNNVLVRVRKEELELDNKTFMDVFKAQLCDRLKISPEECSQIVSIEIKGKIQKDQTGCFWQLSKTTLCGVNKLIQEEKEKPLDEVDTQKEMDFFISKENYQSNKKKQLDDKKLQRELALQTNLRLGRIEKEKKRQEQKDYFLVFEEKNKQAKISAKKLKREVALQEYIRLGLIEKASKIKGNGNRERKKELQTSNLFNKIAQCKKM